MLKLPVARGLAVAPPTSPSRQRLPTSRANGSSEGLTKPAGSSGVPVHPQPRHVGTLPPAPTTADVVTSPILVGDHPPSYSRRDQRIRCYVEKLIAALPHYRPSSSLVSAYGLRVPAGASVGARTANATPTSDTAATVNSSSFLLESPAPLLFPACMHNQPPPPRQDLSKQTAVLECAPVTLVRVLGMGSSGIVMYAERRRGAVAGGLPNTESPERSSSATGRVGMGAIPSTSQASLLSSSSPPLSVGSVPQQPQPVAVGLAASPRRSGAGGDSANMSSSRSGGMTGFALKFIDLEDGEFKQSSFAVKHAVREIETMRKCEFFSIMRVFNYFFIYSDGSVSTNVDEVKAELLARTTASTPAGLGAASPGTSRRARWRDEMARLAGWRSVPDRSPCSGVATSSNDSSSSDDEDDMPRCGAPSLDSPARYISAIAIEMEYLNNGDLRGEIAKRREALEKKKERWSRSHGSSAVARLGLDLYTTSPSVLGAIPELSDCYFSKNDIAVIFFQILAGIYYLHERQGIMHRDVKSENVLLSGDGTVKIGDFGFSKKFDTADGTTLDRASPLQQHSYRMEESAAGSGTAGTSAHTTGDGGSVRVNGSMHQPQPSSADTEDEERERRRRFNVARRKVNSFCGTPLYMAPEMWSRDVNYTSKIDLFSAGVILYEMLTLQPPTSVESPTPGSALSAAAGSQTSNGPSPVVAVPRRCKARERRILITPEVRAFVVALYGQEYLDLLLLLLKTDPRERPSAVEVLVKFPAFRVVSGQLIHYAVRQQRRGGGGGGSCASGTGERSPTSAAAPLSTDEEPARIVSQLRELHAELVAFDARARLANERVAPNALTMPRIYECFAALSDGSSRGSTPVPQSTSALADPEKEAAPLRVVHEGRVWKLSGRGGAWRARYLMLVQLSATRFQLRLGITQAAMQGEGADVVAQDFADFVDIIAGGRHEGPRDSKDELAEERTALMPTTPTAKRDAASWYAFSLLSRNGDFLRVCVPSEAEREDWLASMLAARDYLTIVSKQAQEQAPQPGRDCNVGALTEALPFPAAPAAARFVRRSGPPTPPAQRRAPVTVAAASAPQGKLVLSQQQPPLPLLRSSPAAESTSPQEISFSTVPSTTNVSSTYGSSSMLPQGGAVAWGQALRESLEAGADVLVVSGGPCTDGSGDEGVGGGGAVFAHALPHSATVRPTRPAERAAPRLAKPGTYHLARERNDSSLAVANYPSSLEVSGSVVAVSGTARDRARGGSGLEGSVTKDLQRAPMTFPRRSGDGGCPAASKPTSARGRGPIEVYEKDARLINAYSAPPQTSMRGCSSQPLHAAGTLRPSELRTLRARHPSS